MSTSVMIGRLNASQNATKRAAFWEAGMSSVPASTIGWLARIPTGRPSIVANAVTTLAAQRSRTSSTESSSAIAAATLRTS